MHEVVALREADQFQPEKTQFACGFFAVAMCTSMAPTGQSPTKSTQQLVSDALAWYSQYDGNTLASNRAGMTPDMLYNLLRQVGLHWQGTMPDEAHIKAWLKLGFPLIVEVSEANVVDLELGTNPYPWSPSGYHFIVLTGLDEQGHLLVRDSANCDSLSDPRSLRPGPRHYDTGKLCAAMWSATAIVPPWRPRPPLGFDPTTHALPEAHPIVQVATTPHILSGWKDDGKILTAPNGIPVRDGFRLFILDPVNHWDQDDHPLGPEFASASLETSHPSLGAGSQQIFLYSMLGWMSQRGVFREYVGKELLAARTQVASLQTQLKDASSEKALSPEQKQALVVLSTMLTPVCAANQAIQDLLKGTNHAD